MTLSQDWQGPTFPEQAGQGQGGHGSHRDSRSNLEVVFLDGAKIVQGRCGPVPLDCDRFPNPATEAASRNGRGGCCGRGAEAARARDPAMAGQRGFFVQ